MKYLFLLLLVSFTASAGMEEVYNVYEEAQDNYSYSFEEDGQSAKDYTKPFTGDCTTFSATMIVGVQYGALIFVDVGRELPILEYINLGYVWSCNGRVYEIESYPGKILHEMGVLVL